MTRHTQLLHWLESKLEIQSPTLTLLAGDASFRRYYCLQFKEQHWVIMDAPPEKEDCRPFVEIARNLRKLGLIAPDVIHQNLEQGFLVLTDFGRTDLLSYTQQHNDFSYYTPAIDDLIKLQIKYPIESLAKFDGPHIQTELAIFDQWFLKKHLNIHDNSLSSVYHYLAELLPQAPQVTIHRDYHSRNLMVLPDNNVGLLDFQDMMLGPISYDLASLLKDCYIELPAALRKELCQYFYQNNPLLQNMNYETFSQLLELTAVQRHLKAIGIFCRLHYRDDKPHYLNDIPRTLKYLREVADNYAELKPLSALLRSIHDS